MLVAVISDIHGNIFALNEVIKQIKDNNINRVYFLGDFVGYYYHPKQVFDELKKLNTTMIMGNHEQYLIDCIDGLIDIHELSKKYGSGHEIGLNELSISDIKNIRNLPKYHLETIEDVKIACFHGSPFDENFYLYPNTDKSIFLKCDLEADFTFVGHSHYPFVVKLPNSTLINVGSVGQSRKKGGIASWCVFNTENGVIEMQSTPYNVNPLIDLINQHDPGLVYLKKILKRGNEWIKN